MGAVEQTVEFCPSARADAFMKDGVCQFCHTNHKIASKLTGDHRKILRLLASGDTPKQVAAQLAINYNTLHHRLRDARLIVGARTNEQMIAMLAREGSLT